MNIKRWKYWIRNAYLFDKEKTKIKHKEHLEDSNRRDERGKEECEPANSLRVNNVKQVFRYIKLHIGEFFQFIVD